MRVAIVGSRNYSNRKLVEDAVQEIARRAPSTIIVSGGARGVDTWAEVAAQKCGLRVVVKKADWEGQGKAAGFLRNFQIIEDCDAVLAFWDGLSHGTQHTVKEARKAGKKVSVVDSTGKAIESL